MAPSYILLAIPFFFLMMGVEWFFARRKNKDVYRLNDSINNLVVGIGNRIFGLVNKGLLFGVAIWVKEHYAIWSIPATWWSFLLALVTFDFLFYWAHRWGHELNIFWGAHSVHHQSEEYNLSVALRQSWFHDLLAFPIFMVVPLMGFEVITFGTAAAVQTIYQFWIHTQTIGRLPDWFEYIFNTPSHHRVHHATNPKYIDKNHAGVFMIWDRMFGTFKQEEAGDEINYGITTQLKSWNPAWANVHYYVELFEKAKDMKWVDRIKLIFARPGWLPSYMGGFQAPKEVDKNTFVKYDATSNKLLVAYGVFQFFILLAATIQYMRYFNSLTLFYKAVFFVLIFITMMITGGIFESKKWVFYAEYARLVIALLFLNVFYYTVYISWFNVFIATSITIFLLSIVFFTYSLLTNRTSYNNES
jgi:sterol desaturase/sphingolipid hydroxylase (fatty acid hydroxylase superfamily)